MAADEQVETEERECAEEYWDFEERQFDDFMMVKKAVMKEILVRKITMGYPSSTSLQSLSSIVSYLVRKHQSTQYRGLRKRDKVAIDKNMPSLEMLSRQVS